MTEKYSDSGYDTFTDIDGITKSRPWYSTSYVYESKHVANIGFMYAFKNAMAIGTVLDFSFGKIKVDTTHHDILNDPIFEGSFYGRFATGNKHISLGIRPEILVSYFKYFTTVTHDTVLA